MPRGVIDRLQQQLQQVQGIQLFMEPVQNITVDDRVSRTQYQYTLEDPDINELSGWTAASSPGCASCRSWRMSPPISSPAGWRCTCVIDRVTASRLGIAPATIDNTLYDAFGQRQINTMYTQINQYHVILESDPQFQQDPDMLNHLYIQANASSGTSGAAAAASFSSIGSSSAGSNALTGSALYTPSANILSAPMNALTPRSVTSSSNQGAGSAGATSSTPSNAVPLSAFAHFEKTTEPLTIAHQGQFPAITVSFDLSPSGSLGSAIKAVNRAQQDLHMPGSVQAGFQGTAAIVHRLAVERAVADSRGAGRGLYRARRSVRELHPSGNHPVDAAIGRRGRAAGADPVRPGPERGRHSSASSC